MKRALLFCCLLLLTVTSAAPGTLTAEKAHAEGVTASADMAVLRLRSDMGGGTATAFSMTAPHVRVEVDRSDTVVDAIQRVYVMDYTTTNDHSGATITGRLRDSGDHEFVLGAWPGHTAPAVSWESECVDFGPSIRQEDRTEAEINRSRPSRVVPLDSAIRPTPCGASTWNLSIRGDFLLSAWGWSLTIDSNQGHNVVETGVERQGPGQAWAAEAFLFASNATLRVSLDQWSAFYVKGANVTADALSLTNARGAIREDDGGHVLAGEDVTLYGVRDTSITGQGVGEALQVEVPPNRDFSPSTQGPESPLQTPYTLAAVAALALAVAAGLFVRRVPLIYEARERRRGYQSVREPRTRLERRGVGWRLMARTALMAGRPRLALRFVSRARRLFDDQPEVRLMVARALEDLGRYDEAMTHFAAASGMWSAYDDREQQALALLGAVTCNVETGQTQVAFSLFRQVADLDPDLALARLGSPALLALKEHPDYENLRRRLEWSRSVYRPTKPAPSKDPDPSCT